MDRRPDRPQGVDRGDLYQLTSYLAALDVEGASVGMLLYPADPHQASTASGEAYGPWLLPSGSEVRFQRVAVSPEGAVADVAELLETTLERKPTPPSDRAAAVPPR